MGKAVALQGLTEESDKKSQRQDLGKPRQRLGTETTSGHRLFLHQQSMNREKDLEETRNEG